MKKRCLALLVLFCVSSLGLAQQTDLPKLKTQYDQAVLVAETETAKNQSVLLSGYTKDLQTLRTKLQMAGDLDKLKVTLAEITRVQAEESLPATLPDVPEVKALVTIYQQRSREVKTRHAQRIVALASQYDKSLDTLQRKLTQEGKLDDATAVQTERKLLPGTEPLATSRGVLASVPGQMTKDAPKKPDPTYTTDQAPIPVSRPATAPSEQFVGTQKEETRLIVPSKTPHILKGMYDVPKGRTLQIAAGCVFLADKEGLLNVNGVLVVEGTADKPVLFKGQRSGIESWKGLRFDHSEPSVINYAQIQGADVGLTINAANPTFEGCVIVNCKTGVAIIERRKPVFKNCLIDGNLGHGIQMHHSYAILDHCTITGNKGFGIFCDYYGEPVIESSIIKDNTEGGIRGSGYDHRIEAHNSIVFGNRGPDVVVNGPTDWDFAGNWWGNANTQKFTTQGDTANLTCIQDGADNTGKGRVKLAEFLRVAPTNCGASVVKTQDENKNLRPSRKY